jgi:hypothetical protein
MCQWWVLNPSPFEELAMAHFDQLCNFAPLAHLKRAGGS